MIIKSTIKIDTVERVYEYRPGNYYNPQYLSVYLQVEYCTKVC